MVEEKLVSGVSEVIVYLESEEGGDYDIIKI